MFERIDPREAYAETDWNEYEAYLDGILDSLERERANAILIEEAELVYQDIYGAREV